MLIALRPTQETIDIVAALKGRWHGSYAMCVCPAHADRTPSLSVRQGERGILVTVLRDAAARMSCAKSVGPNRS